MKRIAATEAADLERGIDSRIADCVVGRAGNLGAVHIEFEVVAIANADDVVPLVVVQRRPGGQQHVPRGRAQFKVGSFGGIESQLEYGCAPVLVNQNLIVASVESGLDPGLKSEVAGGKLES